MIMAISFILCSKIGQRTEQNFKKHVSASALPKQILSLPEKVARRKTSPKDILSGEIFFAYCHPYAHETVFSGFHILEKQKHFGGFVRNNEGMFKTVFK